MTTYQIIRPVFYAIRVENNGVQQETVASIFNGSVKGTMLRPADREIEFSNGDNEVRAKVGEWVVKHPTLGILIMSDEEFNQSFKQ